MPIYALDYAAPVIDPQAFVHPDAVVIGAVELAAGASVWPGAVLRGDHGLIKVGERTSVQDGTIVHTTEEYPTVIGADCVVGHRAHLEGCVVEDGCLIGSGSLVLNRARVAAGAVVAAAALVLEDMTVPAGALAIGVPATIRPDAGLRQRSWIKHAVQDYLDLAERHRTGLRRLDRPSVIAAGTGTPELSAPGGRPELSAWPGRPELSAYPVASRSAWSVSGEGAFEGDPAAGVGEVEGGVGVAGDGPAEGVDEVVVVDVAEQGQAVPGWWRRPGSRGGCGGRWPRRPAPRSRASGSAGRGLPARGAVRGFGAGGPADAEGRPSPQRIAPIWAPQHRARTWRAVRNVPCPVWPGGGPLISPGRGAGAGWPGGRWPAPTDRPALARPRPAPPVTWAVAPGLPAAWARVSSLTRTVMCGAAPCRSGAVPASRAALQAATRPSIRRCAAVRPSPCPPGGLNASAAVRRIS